MFYLQMWFELVLTDTNFFLCTTREKKRSQLGLSYWKSPSPYIAPHNRLWSIHCPNEKLVCASFLSHKHCENPTICTHVFFMLQHVKQIRNTLCTHIIWNTLNRAKRDKHTVKKGMQAGLSTLITESLQSSTRYAINTYPWLQNLKHLRWKKCVP